MTQQQTDAYKAIIGDGLSRVSISRDLSDKDFGNGGGVSVTVTLTCDQSGDALNRGIHLAHEIADSAAWHYHDLLHQQLVQRGIFKP